MDAFARRTGLTSEEPPTRYLWTDAFAVANFIGLSEASGEAAYQRLAGRLIEQVHQTLGRHRPDDQRDGWLSGLTGQAAREHPTRGGLRIGKPLPERGPEAPVDERLEWERDGQYFHYLTKWMHALDRMARTGGEAHFARWAGELAQTASAAFVYQDPTGRPRMYWKMSIDLTQPLVPSMGHHDPLDGYITLQQLLATVTALDAAETELPAELQAAIRPFAGMLQDRDWGTSDPLGLGGLLMDATRLAQLIWQGQSDDRRLLVDLLRSADQGIRRWTAGGALGFDTERRLAFRELGLAIGLQGLGLLGQSAPADDTLFAPGSAARTQFERLMAHQQLAERLIAFWSALDHRRSRTWSEHEDINAVMLATALAPQGLLRLPRPTGAVD